MSRLRAFGRWLTDWRTGATLVASILVALLAIIVVDAIQSRRAADARADRTIGELEVTVGELRRRGERIDALAAQLEEASGARAQLAEEVRALRELLIDGGMLEPRPAATVADPRTGPGASPRATPSPTPRPSAQPRPSPAPRPTPSPSPSCTVRNPITGTCLVPPDQKGRP